MRAAFEKVRRALRPHLPRSEANADAATFAVIHALADAFVERGDVRIASQVRETIAHIEAARGEP